MVTQNPTDLLLKIQNSGDDVLKKITGNRKICFEKLPKCQEFKKPKGRPRTRKTCSLRNKGRSNTLSTPMAREGIGRPIKNETLSKVLVTSFNEVKMTLVDPKTFVDNLEVSSNGATSSNKGELSSSVSIRAKRPRSYEKSKVISRSILISKCQNSNGHVTPLNTTPTDVNK